MTQRAKNRKKAGTDRKTDGTFSTGNRANPKGRPKIPEEVKMAFQADCEMARLVLVGIAEDKEAKDQDRIKAAIAILDRGLGKPAQSVELTGAGGGPIETAVHVKPDPAFAASVLGELASAGLTGDDG